MVSKQVSDRKKSTDKVVEFINTNKNKLKDALVAIYSPYLKSDEQMPDFALLAELVGRRLADKAAVMVSKQEAYEAELKDDDLPRKLRDEAAEKLYSQVVEVREAVIGLFGSKYLTTLGFSGSTPQDPFLLIAYARGIENAIQQAVEKGTLPAPRLKGASWDTAEALSDLKAARIALENALAKVTQEEREAQAAIVERNRATEEQGRSFTRSAGFLEKLFSLADLEDLGARLRPSPQRPGHTEQEVDSQEGAPDKTPGSAPSAPPEGG